MSHHVEDKCVPVNIRLTDAEKSLMVALGFAVVEGEGLHITEKGDKWLRDFLKDRSPNGT